MSNVSTFLFMSLFTFSRISNSPTVFIFKNVVEAACIACTYKSSAVTEMDDNRRVPKIGVLAPFLRGGGWAVI